MPLRVCSSVVVAMFVGRNAGGVGVSLFITVNLAAVVTFTIVNTQPHTLHTWHQCTQNVFMSLETQRHIRLFPSISALLFPLFICTLHELSMN